MPKSRQISLFTDARSTMPQRSNEEFASRVEMRKYRLKRGISWLLHFHN